MIPTRKAWPELESYLIPLERLCHPISIEALVAGNNPLNGSPRKTQAFHASKSKLMSFPYVSFTSSMRFLFRYRSVKTRIESVIALSSFEKVDFPKDVALGSVIHRFFAV